MIDGKTQLIGLIGWPVSHSLSPAMHNAAARALGLNWRYLPLPVPPGQVAAAMRGLQALSFRGVNVTIPHKQTVMPLLDELGPGVDALGVVNMVLFKRGSAGPGLVDHQPGDQRSVGYNTDWSGFLEDVRAHMALPDGAVCWVLGAGGSARAVAYALHQAGGRCLLFSRRVEQARRLRHDLGIPSISCHAWPERLDPALARQEPPQLIVNSTPLGMTPREAESPWPEGMAIPPARLLYDLVYNPATTRLMRQAGQAGIPARNGLGMLLNQGVQAFEMWTGIRPDVTVMREALRRHAFK